MAARRMDRSLGSLALFIYSLPSKPNYWEFARPGEFIFIILNIDMAGTCNRGKKKYAILSPG